MGSGRNKDAVNSAHMAGRTSIGKHPLRRSASRASRVSSRASLSRPRASRKARVSHAQAYSRLPHSRQPQSTAAILRLNRVLENANTKQPHMTPQYLNIYNTAPSQWSRPTTKATNVNYEYRIWTHAYQDNNSFLPKQPGRDLMRPSLRPTKSAEALGQSSRKAVLSREESQGIARVNWKETRDRRDETAGADRKSKDEVMSSDDKTEHVGRLPIKREISKPKEVVEGRDAQMRSKSCLDLSALASSSSSGSNPDATGIAEPTPATPQRRSRWMRLSDVKFFSWKEQTRSPPRPQEKPQEKPEAKRPMSRRKSFLLLFR